MPKPALRVNSPLMDDVGQQQDQQPSDGHGEGPDHPASSGDNDDDDAPPPTVARHDNAPRAAEGLLGSDSDWAGALDGADSDDEVPPAQPPAVVKTEPPPRRKRQSEPDTLPTAELKTNNPVSTRKQTPPALQDAKQSVAPSKAALKQTAAAHCGVKQPAASGSKGTASKGATGSRSPTPSGGLKRSAAQLSAGKERDATQQKTDQTARAQSDMTTAARQKHGNTASKKLSMAQNRANRADGQAAAVAGANAGEQCHCNAWLCFLSRDQAWSGTVSLFQLEIG